MSLALKLFPTLPSFDISVCLRKRYFYDRVVDAIKDGARQVMILGGGYDVLMTNLAPRYPNVLFVEVDHPSTAVFKRNAINKIGGNYPNTHLVPSDLSDHKIEERLFDECPEWKQDAKSVVIAEGLLMYLAPDAVRRCLQSIKAVAALGSSFVFSYVMAPDLVRSSMLGSRFGQRLLQWAGEPMLWVPETTNDVREVFVAEGFDANGSLITISYIWPSIVNYRQTCIIPISMASPSKNDYSCVESVGEVFRVRFRYFKFEF